MPQKIVTLKVERESQMGALHLVRNAPGHLPPDHPLAPVTNYLDLLAQSGHRTQRVNLERAVRLLGGDSGLDYEWALLRDSHLLFLRGRLKGKGYSPSVINSTLSAVRGVAKWAWLLGQMDREDFERLRCVRLVPASGERRRPARALSGEEIARLFESCEHDRSLCAIRDAAMLALLYAGGLRRDEACRLDLSAFSRRSHQLAVCGKGDKHRTVYFRDGGARRALNAWLRVRGDEPGAFLCPVNRHSQVINRHLSTSGLYRALERRALSAGLSHFTPHDLRRSVGTHLLDAGEDLDIVRRIFGHVDIRTTQQYIMRGEKEKEQASLKIRVPFRTRVGKGRRRKKKHRHRG